ARVVGEAVLADLDLVTGVEHGRVDALPVDVGAVERADVTDDVAALVGDELRVPPRHGDVVEEDVGGGVPPGKGPLGVEQEAGARRPRGRAAGGPGGRGPRRAHRSHRTARWCATCPAVPARFPCPCTPLSGATGRRARPQDPTIVPDGAGVTGRWVRRRSAAV